MLTPKPIDTSVVVPPAVRAAAARSEALIAEQKSRVTAESNPAPAPTMQDLQGPAPTPVKPFAAPPHAPVAAPAFNQAPPPAPSPSPAPPQENWEHRYHSMKGRFDNAQAQITQMSEQITGLQRTLAVMTTQQPAAPAAPADVRFVTPEDEKEYGKEFLDVVGKRSREVVSSEVADLRAELKQLKAQVGGVASATQMTAQEKMFSTLDANIPNWREINRNADFLNWLRLPDTYSGAIRLDLMRAAHANNDAGRVGAFFRGFLADEAATSPAIARDAITGANRPPKVDLASFAAPGRARQAGGNTPPPAKPSFTRAEVSAFYADVRKGAYAGREAEKLALEKAIFDAGTEGRIN